MADIVVVGGCIVDLISYAKRFPKPGETIAGSHFSKGFGGKGANQCVMAKNLGASTAIIAKLGDDSFGHEYLENLKENNIHSDFVTISKTSSTSTAAISVSDAGQNSIIYIPGAIMELTPQDIEAAESIIKQSKVMLCTYECPLDSLIAALTLARKHNVKTVVNAAPAAAPSYENIYPLTDVICLNETEAEDAAQVPVKSIEDASLAIEALFKKGCSTVILTLGSKGAVFQSKNESTFTNVPARNVKAIDSTGAGDAFMGSFVYFLAYHLKMSFKEAVERSCEIATLSVLKKGTQTSFP
ncbi:Ribokinase, partial [Stegodyphus mimosarum]